MAHVCKSSLYLTASDARLCGDIETTIFLTCCGSLFFDRLTLYYSFWILKNKIKIIPFENFGFSLQSLKVHLNFVAQ